MGRPPLRIVAVIATTVALAAVAFGVAAATTSTTLSPRDALMLAALAGMLFLARRSPLPLGPNQHLIIGTAPLFAAVLLLPLVPMVAGGVAAVLIADRSRRAPWFQVSFNTATEALQAICGGAIIYLASNGGTIVDVPPLLIPLTAATAALTMYALNVCLVETIVSVQHRHFSLAEFLQRRRVDVATDGALYALGLLIALVAAELPGAVVLLAAPAILIYRSLHQSLSFQKQLEHRANHDELTELPNRRLFTERLTRTLSRAVREHSSLAVLFLDIDGFKRVNDTLGHGAGDELLQTIAQRLKERARAGDTVARLGGDEFIILAPNSTEDDAAQLGEEILRTLREPTVLRGREIQVDASIGIVHSSGEDSVPDLLTRADIAMYHAKEAGKGRYEFFVPTMATAVQEQMELELELRRALDENELVVFYQPTMSLVEDRIAGCEALVRWRHPTRGMVSPAQFIPIAEETGLIVPLGQQVLREACAQHVRWAAELPDAGSLTMSVNLSTRQLQEASVVDQVAEILAETGMSPSSLVLEITESAMLQDTEEMLARLMAIKALGVQLALDDFGTGYSSLSYLHRFPFDILKIDRAFVDGLERQAHTTALAGTIVRMGRSLGMKVVAEGIEQEAQAEVLRGLHCDYGQGYLYSRPVPPESLRDLLLSERTTTAPEPAGHAVDGGLRRAS